MSKLSKKQYKEFYQNTDLRYKNTRSDSFDNYMLNIDIEEMPPCYDDLNDYLHWKTNCYHCGSTCRTHTPCHDCENDFMIKMARKGRCLKIVIK